MMQLKVFEMRLIFTTLILLFFFVSTLTHSASYSEGVMTNKELLSLVTDMIEKTETNQSDKDFVTKNLDFLGSEYPAETNYLLGQIYYFGLYGDKKVKNAVDHLMVSSKLKYPQAQYLLGSIFVTEKDYLNIVDGISLLEDAADGGIPDAMYNLYSLYRQGMYQKSCALNWIKKAASLGYEQAMIFSSYEEYLMALDSSDKPKLGEIVKYLISSDFTNFSGERYYLLSSIYNEPSPLSDESLRLKYLTLSAEAGYVISIDILEKYREMLKEESKMTNIDTQH
jgi:TPR repeat protein